MIIIVTNLKKRFKKQKYLQLMVLPAFIWLVLFRYMPMVGIQIAFKDYMFNKGIFGSEWVGLVNFKEFFNDPNILEVIRNTLAISGIKVVFIFPLPIILAISLNEVKNNSFKRIVQTISYFPHFLSWAVVALMATSWLSPSIGFVNDMLIGIGIIDKPYLFLGEPKAFWWVGLGLEIWKAIGYASIIYLAAIAGIDQEMYESAFIDGANRLQRIVHITIPSILGTIMILMILNIGNMLSGGLYASNFQISYLLGNSMNAPRSEIIGTYVLKVGISQGRYAFATAVGLLNSIVSMVLLLIRMLLGR